MVFIEIIKNDPFCMSVHDASELINSKQTIYRERFILCRKDLSMINPLLGFFADFKSLTL